MSGDTREDMLSRILEIMGTVAGITSVVRNRALRDNESRPAMVLLDGDETPRLTSDLQRLRGRASIMLPQIMVLRPEIYILLKEGRPQNDAVGEQLNAYRVDFLTKVWNDTTLAQIVGSNGSMVYVGCETDLKSGSALTGQMKLDFAFNYVLQPR